jgi:colanic acid/amylovoran biosynthesis protein
MEKSISHIAVMGTPATAYGNRGVMALGAALVRLLMLTTPSARITLLQMNPKPGYLVLKPFGEASSIPIVNCRLSKSSSWNEHLLFIVIGSVAYRLFPARYVRSWLTRHVPWIRMCAEAAMVGDIRGGDSFSDIYGMRRFVIASLEAFSAQLVARKFVHFPQTYGPFKSRFAKLVAKHLLGKSVLVMARDHSSAKVAESLLGSAKKLLICPDVAFALPAVAPPLIETFPKSDGVIGKGTIGLNINGLMYNGGYDRSNMFHLDLDYPKFVQDLIARLLAESDYDILLVPHTYARRGDVESDNAACEDVRDSLDSSSARRVSLISGEYDQHEIKSIIAHCDFFIGSRMHSCIAALSQGIPCVGVAYSFKFEGVFESVGMRDWVIDGRCNTHQAAVEKAVELYRKREEIRNELGKAGDKARETLLDVFSKVAGYIR